GCRRSARGRDHRCRRPPRPAPSVSTRAGSAAGDGSPPRCLLPVAQLVESCAGAWSVPRGPVGDVGRRGLVRDALELAPGPGDAALGDEQPGEIQAQDGEETAPTNVADWTARDRP